MDTGTRSLRKVFRNGSCNDCPLAIIRLLVMTLNSSLSVSDIAASLQPEDGRRAPPGARCSAAVYHSAIQVESAFRLILSRCRAVFGRPPWIQVDRSKTPRFPHATTLIVCGPIAASRRLLAPPLVPKGCPLANVPRVADSRPSESPASRHGGPPEHAALALHQAGRRSSCSRSGFRWPRAAAGGRSEPMHTR